jgi:hypothetical protein
MPGSFESESVAGSAQNTHLTARQWREARRILQAMPPADRAAVVATWNASPYSKDSASCLAFVRQHAKRQSPGLTTTPA